MGQPLKLLSMEVVEHLLADVDINRERYVSGDFGDFERQNGWALETKIATWNPEAAEALDSTRTPQAEARNSLLIYRALEGMTPALARDERIWARLAHVECLAYARSRWIRGEERQVEQIRAHFFAPGLPGCRDDNAIGRLWWNAHIAKLASPHDIELGLSRLLGRANIRLQVIDRADTAFRQPLIAGIVRALGNPWFETYDAAIADFMFEVNKRSGGLIFEALSDAQVDSHLEHCLDLAKERSSA